MTQKSLSASAARQQNPLSTHPVNTLFRQMAMPMVIGMLLNGLYNLVDAFFVARFIGSHAMAAVSVVFPLQMIIIALATTISNGTSILVSQYLGANRQIQVNRVILAAVRLIVICSVLIAAVAITLHSSLLQLLQVPTALQESVLNYFMPLALASILLFALSLLSDLLRAQGLMKALFSGILASAVANVILDWLFIVVFDWGVSGAAAATLTGQGIGCAIGIFYLAQQGTMKQLLAQANSCNIAISTRILSLGMPVLLQYLGAALIMATVNALIGASATQGNAGDSAQWLTAYGIIGRFNIFIILPLIAMTNAAQTIISFNYGGGNTERVQQTFRHGIKANMKYLSLMAGIFLIVPEILLAGFTSDSAVIATGAKIARMMFVLLPLAGISFMSTAYFQGVGKAKQALLLTLTKVYVLILPTLFVINALWGYQKLWYAFPLADMATMLLAGYLFISQQKNNTVVAVPGEH